MEISRNSSTYLDLECGLPQGSILGPIFFNLFTNEFPEFIKDPDCANKDHIKNKNDLFTQSCSKCGEMNLYADDSTVSIRGNTIAELDMKVLPLIAKFTDLYSCNFLKLNRDKTMILLNGTDMKLSVERKKGVEICIVEGENMIKSNKYTKLLGVNLAENLKWNQHLLTSTDSVKSKCRSAITAMRRIANMMSFKQRLKLANGLVISRLVASCQLWIGTTVTNYKRIQKIQNCAARMVTGKSKRLRIRSETLLKQCNWLPVKKMAALYSANLLHNIITDGKLKYLCSALEVKDNGQIECRIKTKLQTVKNGWLWKTVEIYNRVPSNIWRIVAVKRRKTELRNWIRDHDPGDYT